MNNKEQYTEILEAIEEMIKECQYVAKVAWQMFLITYFIVPILFLGVAGHLYRTGYIPNAIGFVILGLVITLVLSWKGGYSSFGMWRTHSKIARNLKRDLNLYKKTGILYKETEESRNE